MRTEHDCLGSMSLKGTLYYGIQTQRNVSASTVTGISLGVGAQDFLIALAHIKKAAAYANFDAGHLEDDKAKAIAVACHEVITGHYLDQFPVDIFTGGGGVGMNMNMNEVLANRANEICTGHKGYDHIHPNTHVNMGQSTNDVVPAAMHLALHTMLQNVRQACIELKNCFEKKSKEYENSVKLARTCLQDALPITFGQELSGHVAFLQRQISTLEQRMHSCLHLPLGGTAVGTGLGTMPGFVPAFYQHLQQALQLNVQQNANLFDALSHADFYGDIAYTLKSLASGLSKIASDLRLLSSGPRGGLGELKLPEILPGSSIMPGKINPTIPELIMQIYFQVSGHEHTVSLATERGDLNLNVWEAVILKCLSESCMLLQRGMQHFAHQCITGLELQEAYCQEQAENSTALGAVISTVFGYEIGLSIVKKAQKENKSIAQVVVEAHLLTQEEAAELLRPINLTSAEKSWQLITELKKIHNRNTSSAT